MYNSTIAVGASFSVLCDLSFFSGYGFLSDMQCVTLQWSWVSLCYAVCHSTVAVGLTPICKGSPYNGSGFLSGMQCDSLQWQYVSPCYAVCHSTVAVCFTVIQCQYTMFLCYTFSL